MGGMPRCERKLRVKDRRVPRARALRRAMTDAERKLWWHLRQLRPGKSHFRRQATIGPYYADFTCHEVRLVIEVDGSGHAVDNQIAADIVRTKFMEARGYRVLRFWISDVLKDIDAVMLTIYEAMKDRLEVAAPHP